MSKNMEIAKKFLQAIEDGNIEKVLPYLSEDFVFEGPVPQPLGKQQYAGFLQTISEAFSDFKYNVSDFSENDNAVSCNMKITGKHTGKLELPNMEPILATNKSFELPIQKSTVFLNGEKITKLSANVSKGGGIEGIIKQIRS